MRVSDVCRPLLESALVHYASWEDSRCSKGERTMKVKGRLAVDVKSDLY
jgi:hypothetical protein